MDKETMKFLKELQNTLNTQEIDGQASPRFWVIYDYKEIPTSEDFADKVKLFVPEYERDYDVEDIYEFIEEANKEELFLTKDDLSNIKSKIDENDLDYVENWVQKHIDEGSFFVNIWEEGFVVPDTMFLTKEDAVNHLESNHYHYTSKAHTYAMTAHRSPTVKKVWDVLEQTDWDKFESVDG